ncbi:MAG: folylpolyglutamate synthase/dihydrofolate synthase family protein [Bryobacterales bacterium]|nr:folylpolyglutamate synthase/dihydrofolate synthase family protein [Bryobacterales bacterium]
MQYPDSVEFLYALGNELKTVKLGLERIGALLAELGDPQFAYRVVHVAGTNGKGSVCAMVAAALEAAGLRTGLYTSPHLIEPTERIRIDGRDLSQEVFLDVFREVHAVAESMVARGDLDMHPTYFETITTMGFLAFAKANIEWAVVEVGLGGRLDATNVVQPALTVVTPVEYDHEAWLGHSIEAIAKEKAGILKAGVPAVLGPQRAEALAVLEARAHEMKAPSYRSDLWRISDLAIAAEGARFHLQRQQPLHIECPLRGAWQVENARTAAAALDLLGIDGEAIEKGIRDVRWPGRLERLSNHPEILVDGAHNPSGCAALAEYIRATQGPHRTWLVFGAMRDKAVSEMVGILYPLADEIILTAPRQPRALRPEALAEEVTPDGCHLSEGEPGKPRVHLAPAFEDAMKVLASAQPEDRVFIAGSLYLAGEAKAWFAARNRKTSSDARPSPIGS